VRSSSAIDLDEAVFTAAPFTRLAELKRLRATGQGDSGLHWTRSIGRIEKAAA